MAQVSSKEIIDRARSKEGYIYAPYMPIYHTSMFDGIAVDVNGLWLVSGQYEIIRQS